MFAFPETPREFAVALTFALAAAAALFLSLMLPVWLSGKYWPAAVMLAFSLGSGLLWLGALRVDPWAVQMRIMAKSGQATPDQAELNRYVFTYFALCLEELSETGDGIATPLARMVSAENQRAVLRRQMRFDDITALNISPLRDDITPGARQVHTFLQTYCPLLKQAALDLRKIVEIVPEDFSFPLRRAEAIEIADGVTDQAVVVSGLCVAAGLPGAHCYEDVGGSNLSKANPDTGIIDKDAGGKWIKGRNYRAPDLGAVLDRTRSIVVPE